MSHRGTRTTRRTFLTTSAGAAAGLVGLAGLGAVGSVAGISDGGTEAPSDFQRVSTRDHFDITWYGDVQLTDGHTEYDYDLVGDLDGVFGDDELLVFVHGWLNDDQEGLDTCYTGIANLQDLGYDAPGIAFSYDADTWVTAWWMATEVAERNGTKLANFTADLLESYPDTDVRYVAHSLGARVVLRSLDQLADWGMTDAVASASLLGGAADNDAVSMGGAYGSDIETAAGRFDNFWKSDDSVLNSLYSTAEFDSAVGEEGCEGTEPANYTDHAVDYVPDHFSYYYEDAGCLPDVYATF